MSGIDKIKRGYEFLIEDCTCVSLVGFKNKNQIPEKAIRENIDDEDFDHEYTDLKTDEWDEADFWGDIYLPMDDDLYMKFKVSA